MSERKYNIQSVAEIVHKEGLGYSIHSYLNAKQIEDEKLSQMWKECSDKMQEIGNYIKPYME